MSTRWAVAGIIAALGLTGTLVGAIAGRLAWPAHLNPWAPLEITAAPNLLTPVKLRRAQADPARCMAALDAGGLRYDAVAERVSGMGCDLRSAVRLQRGAGVALAPPVLLSCRAALAFAMWERHALQSAAARELGSPVVSVQHLGGYACRDLRGGDSATRSGRRSTHATADALDVSSFTTRAGRRVSVREHEAADAAPPPTPDAAKFLRDARQGACRFFDGVLGPEYNAVHSDHFHLEVGSGRFCR